MMNSLVIIKCLVYNHEPYLRQCLDGFVMQKTNFPFYAVVHDDASTDNSAAIIREYAEKYPDIIHPIYEMENQYSKKDGSLGRIMNEACTGAKYIAICEGDDYWTDPLKLQKQVDFLEANPDYSMCFHNVDVLSDREKERDMYEHIHEGDYTGIEIFKKWTIPTCSVVYRNIYTTPSSSKGKIVFGDIFLFLNMSSFGKLYCINQKMGVYRRIASGISYSILLNTALRLVKQYEYFTEYFADAVEIVNYSKHCISMYCVVVMRSTEATKLQKLKHFIIYKRNEGEKLWIISTLKYICKLLLNKV